MRSTNSSTSSTQTIGRLFVDRWRVHKVSSRFHIPGNIDPFHPAVTVQHPQRRFKGLPSSTWSIPTCSTIPCTSYNLGQIRGRSRTGQVTIIKDLPSHRVEFLGLFAECSIHHRDHPRGRDPHRGVDLARVIHKTLMSVADEGRTNPFLDLLQYPVRG